MSEDTSTNVEQSAQTTEADSNVDYKTLYHQEVKNSKSQRGRKQELELKMEQLELKSEEDRQAKMIAEGKKDELLQEQSSRLKALEKELGSFKQAEDSQKAKLLEQIPEDNRMYYENMNIEQQNVIPTISAIIKEDFKRKPFEDFKYLLEELEPPIWLLIIVFSLNIIVSLIIARYFVINENKNKFNF